MAPRKQRARGHTRISEFVLLSFQGMLLERGSLDTKISRMVSLLRLSLEVNRREIGSHGCTLYSDNNPSRPLAISTAASGSSVAKPSAFSGAYKSYITHL
jgi:hypothetical protein